MSLAEDREIDVYDPNGMYINTGSNIWRTREGLSIEFRHMSDSHIINSINLLDRKGRNIPSKMLEEKLKRKL